MEELKSRGDIPTIPVAEVKIRGIIPDRTMKCKLQAFIQLQIGKAEFSHIFLVVSKTNFNVILGIDFLNYYQASINIPEENLILQRNNLSVESQMYIKTEPDGEEKEISPVPREEEEEEEDQDKEFNRCCRVVNNILRNEEKDSHPYDLIQIKAAEIHGTEEQKEMVKRLLLKHKAVFDNKPGKIPNFQYALLVNDWSPFKTPIYPIPEKYYPQVGKAIEELERDGIIMKANSPYLNPIVVIPKPDNSLRICLDARAINERLIPENDQVPSVRELLRRFQGMNFLTSIDVTSSFYHIELEEKSRLLTGFLYGQQTYIFLRLPFGVRNASSALIRALERSLTPEVKEFTTRFIDDLLIASKTFEEHMVKLDMLLSNLTQAGFRVNLKKSTFCQPEVKFLGHCIDGSGIRPNSIKINAISNFPRPTKVKQVRQFLGICNFFASHCPRYTQTVSPLQDLLKKSQKWQWTESAEKAFQATKEMLINNIKLSYPDFQKPFIVQTDASKCGVGAILYQEDQDNPTRKSYIAFLSRKLRSHEKNYTTTEIEMLAIIYALMYWKKIIYGFPIIIRTDHHALTFMLRAKFTSERVARWTLFLQQYDIKLEHCSGKANILADCLSRNPDEETTEIQAVELVDEDEEFLRKLKYFQQSQKRDRNLRPMIDYLKGNLEPSDPYYRRVQRKSHNYLFQNDILYKFVDHMKTKLRVVVPSKLIVSLIWHVHRVTGHGGIDITEATIKETFTWEKLRKSICQTLKACDTCQRVKHCSYLRKQKPIPIIPQAPCELYAMDLYGQIPTSNRRHKFIIVTIDVFSKYLTLFPIQKANAKAILWRLRKSIIPAMGCPSKLQTDHGTQFTSMEFKRGMEELNIKHIFNSIRYPQSNSAERIMQNIAKYCRIYCKDNHDSWVQILPQIMEFMNNHVHEATKLIPSVVHFNRYPVRTWDGKIEYPKDRRPTHQETIQEARQNLHDHAERRWRRVRKKKFHRPLREGELVLLRKPAISDPTNRYYAKFAPLFIGPYKIKKSMGNNAYKVESMEGRPIGTYNSANLRIYYRS